MSWLFNITNFISSRWQVFGCINVLKKLHNIDRKTPVLQCILIELQISSLHSKTWIMEETPAQVFPCGFCKNFKNAFFYKIAPHDSFYNFNIAEVQFSPTEKRMFAYQGVRNVSFSENFAYVLNGWSFQWVYQTWQILYYLKVTVKWNIAL